MIRGLLKVHCPCRKCYKLLRSTSYRAERKLKSDRVLLSLNEKLYSSRTSMVSNTEIVKRENSILGREKQNEEKYRVQRKLLPFLDVAVNSNMITEAYNTLRHYHNQLQTNHTTLDDIRVYNSVLEGCANQGQWELFENVIDMMFNGQVKPNLQTFVYAIECASRAGKNNEINEILTKIKSSGLDINNLLIDCHFVRDKKDVVFNAIRSNFPTFKPNEKENLRNYNCKLLDELNTSSSRFYKPLGSHKIAENLKDLIAEQLDREKQSYLRITSFDNRKESMKENIEIINKLQSYMTEWKTEMVTAFQNEVDSIRIESGGFEKEVDIFLSRSKNGRFGLVPYLCCLKPEDYVEILYYEFLTMIANFDKFAIELGSLHRALGYKVMETYLLQKKMKNGVLNQSMKFYSNYCDYFVNSHSTSQFNGREYWELLRKNYSESCVNEQPEYRWPRGIVWEVGKIMFSVMQKVIKLDLNYLENKNKSEKNVVSPFATATVKGQENFLRYREIIINSEVLRYFKFLSRSFFFSNAQNIPMICPPVPWTSVSSGGYLLNHTFSSNVFLPLIMGNKSQRSWLENKQNLFSYFDAVNHSSSCPWIINKKVLSIAIDIFQHFDNYRQLPENNTNRQRLVKLLFGVKKSKLKLDDQLFELRCKLSIAKDLNEKIFWFPHQIDFRGRINPIPSQFNYRKSDIERGLLLFAKEEPLGEKGLDWLKIHLSNLNGQKRYSFKKRINYCNNLLSEIMDSADNPLTGSKWWQKSENPWQTLACCIELTCALRSSNPQTFISRLPVHQDGSCNGLQHYSALARDSRLANQVNLELNDHPRDFYTKIAEELERKRKEDAENGLQIAKFLEGFINRDFVKTPIMAMMHGTPNSSYSQIEKLIFNLSPEFSDEQKRIAIEYLMNIIKPIVREWFLSVNKIKNWLSQNANLISNIDNQPIEWISPIGLLIIQPYHTIGKVKLQMKNSIRVEKIIPTKESNKLKQTQSFSSNFIQSLDATHMILTNLFCNRAGITFTAIHDSFWTHANCVSEMNKICRQQFVTLHSEPLLEYLSEQFDENFFSVNNTNLQNEVKGVKRILSKVPSKGKFNLENVLKSQYFFS